MHRGKLVVVSVFVLAVILATSGLIYRYLQTSDVVAFWGARPSQRISSPDRVELWELEPGGGDVADAHAHWALSHAMEQCKAMRERTWS